MKKVVLFLALGISCSVLYAQTQRTLNSVRKQFNEEFERLRREGKTGKENASGDGLMQQFRRWEYMMRSRTLPGGIIPDGSHQWNEWHKYQATHSDQFKTAVALPAWKQVGNSLVPSNGGGAGRVNVVRFDPVNTNIIYAGTAGGGVWKTTNGGGSWTPLGDEFPVTSIADIAIDPNNGNNIYVATGDGAGYEFGVSNDFWGGVYTSGILRSTDGGITWAKATPIFDQSSREIVQRLVINPSNANVLLAATRTAVYRTTNGGNSWRKVLTAHCYDMEWKPGDPLTIYAGGDGNLYRSTDGGANWSTLKNGIGTGRMSIEVSASNPLVIYALAASTLQKSVDGGTTWAAKSFPSGAGFYGYYDLVLSCADANSDYLVAGGLNTVKSTNGGTSWSSVDVWYSFTSPNYVHADKHAAVFYPGSTSNILLGTDGGVFQTNNGGSSWIDLSNGMAIAQVYRLGTTPQNTNLVISGWQDNGCNKWDGTSWRQLFGADGMEAAIDPTNQNTLYECYQYGALQRSLDGGLSWSYIAPSSGDWITPFVIDPVVSTRLYYATSSLYKSDNRGNSWSLVPGVNFSSTGGYASAIAVAPSNNNILYVTSPTKMYRVDISTNTATVITGTLPVNLTGINYIAVSNTDPNKVWVVLGGYSNGNKVFKSTNGGTTWTNVSGTLPNLPVSTIVYQNGSNDRVFIGTDIGVFATDNTQPDWLFYNNKLPNVMIHELEINYTSNKLVAATYGRGIWEVTLPAPSPAGIAQKTVKQAELAATVYPNPSNGIVNIQVPSATQEVQLEIYKLTGEKVMSKTFSATEAKAIRIDISRQPFGNYIIRMNSGDAAVSKEVQLVK